MGSTEPTVAVVGSYNVGLTMRVGSFPTPGETVIGRDFAEGPGGKGSNQAIAAARLGGDARLVARVGADRYGEDARALWEREGVDATAVDTDPETHTGVGFVIVEEGGENEITVAPGANDRLGGADVRSAGADVRSAGAVGAADVVLVQLEIGDEPVRAAVEAADEETNVVCNPAPARDLPADVLAGVDYLTPNEGEARALAGMPEAPPEELAAALLETGVGTVVLTLGEAGALLVTPETSERVAAPSVEAVDTTGAGDTFNGALAVALAEGMDDRAAVRFACAAGALAVTGSEVVPAIPRRAAVEDLL